MSDYTEVSFYLKPNDKYIEDVKTKMDSLWDAWSIKDSLDGHGRTIYLLTIYELDFKESITFLDKLKDEFSLYFFIEYGCY